MDTENIKEVLAEYVQNPTTWFYWYHNPKRLKTLQKDAWRFECMPINGDICVEKNLHGFFNAVLDEMRIKKANDFARYALHISGNKNLAYFREAVTKREATADIDADRQRDHAVHTLYNYLLGWYIFDYSDHPNGLQTEFRKRFATLGIDLTQHPENISDYKPMNFCKKNDLEFNEWVGVVNEFGDVWPIASLLHDIGYILEGKLSSASPEVENERVSNGSKIIHDYFNHWFWRDYGVDFRAAQNIAKILDVEVPDFKSSRSLASLGDHLRDIGSCENIRKRLKDDMSNKPINPPLSIQDDYGLNREAFSLWKEHYKAYGTKIMLDILRSVEDVYKDKMWVGSKQGKNQGKRNLDHGVCSGIVTLQALTFFTNYILDLRILNGDFLSINNGKSQKVEPAIAYRKKYLRKYERRLSKFPRY